VWREGEREREKKENKLAAYLDMMKRDLLDWCRCTGKVGQIFAGIDFRHACRAPVGTKGVKVC
jgi:hypothetical protein